MSTLRIERTDHERMVRVGLAGELDLSTAPEVEDELVSAEALAPAVLMLDLSDLTFLDSTGLRLVLGADDRASREGRRLVIVPGPEPVHRVFRIALLDRRLEFVAAGWTPEADAS